MEHACELEEMCVIHVPTIPCRPLPIEHSQHSMNTRFQWTHNAQKFNETHSKYKVSVSCL